LGILEEQINNALWITREVSVVPQESGEPNPDAREEGDKE